MTGFDERLGAFVEAFTFWAVVAMLGISGLLALSRASRGAGIVFGGLVGALVISLVPTIMVATSDAVNGVVGDDVGGARPSLMEYAANLSPDWLWTAGVVVAVWVAALVATIVAVLSRLGSKAD
jgi:hypothetical protein